MGLLTGFENFVRQSEPLAMHTWFQLGGPAEYFAEPETVDQLVALVNRCHEEGVAMRMLGQGSNILVRDEGVPDMVIRLSAPAFCNIRIQGRSLTAGGGALLGRAVTTAVHRGLAGLETLIGIPGTVGGALHGNAGTRSGNIGQWTLEATVMAANGEIYQRSSDELVFDYRQSSIDDLVILESQLPLGGGRSARTGPTDAKAVDRQEGVAADGTPVGWLRVQKSPRLQRRRVDRQRGPERHAHRRRRRERPPCQLHHRRARVYRAGRAPTDRFGPQPGA